MRNFDLYNHPYRCFERGLLSMAGAGICQQYLGGIQQLAILYNLSCDGGCTDTGITKWNDHDHDADVFLDASLRSYTV
jgi:hypothetical protein